MSGPQSSVDRAQVSPVRAGADLPSVSLPKGGGAIRGVGEKFAANPVTGTGSMSIPIATTPGRSGLGPSLTLSYDTGTGNGPFGFGWSLSLPAITRKTDKGLPRYLDAEESDVFVLSGAEDLVPVLAPNGTRFKDDSSAPGYVINRYRPRVEGPFARVERWTRQNDSDVHWRSISRDNILTLYGKDPDSRIADPLDPRRIFSWLICESRDDKGNAILYDYVSEDGAGIDLSQAHERNRGERNDIRRKANRYLKSIRYGNRKPLLDNVGVRPSFLTAVQAQSAGWMFEVVFDYDDGHYEQVDLDPNVPDDRQHRFSRASALPGKPWTVRPDPFTSHRACFVVTTYRRCRRIMSFHHIPDLPTGEKGYEGLVRATEFDYADLDYTQPVTIEDELAHQGSTRFASFMRAVIQSGYMLDDTKAPVVRGGVEYFTYLKKSLPPLEFEYGKAKIRDEVLELDVASLENLPAGVDGSTYQWVDLDGEGISGLLTEQAGAWFYKPNLGDGHLGPLSVLAAKPSLAMLSSGRQHLLDLAGDGQLDLASLDASAPGYYERTEDGAWEPFRTFQCLPNLTWDDANLKFVDLNGDGHSDVLVAEQELFRWYSSLAEVGFGPASTVRHPKDEEHGPRLIFADGTQSVYLADMCGDGLADIVRIASGGGDVCYWPNLGYGRFGAKVNMDNAPLLDHPDQFEQRRVRLADIDGSGTTDIIYLGRDGTRLYFNQSGNRLSDPRSLPQLPHLDDVTSVATADLLGNGTACLVWSSPLPADAHQPLRYIDLMGGMKPHLLIRCVNNFGAETEVDYAPSTRFYLADKRAGRPWITRLPFPVHVVERVVTVDHISGNRFVARYAYHHGRFDGPEREFCGFGLVEQWDTEEFAALTTGGIEPAGTNVDVSSYVPPVWTKTWFHTGIYMGRGHVSDFFAGLLDATDVGEYYREPGLTDAQATSLLLEDTPLPPGLTADEEREACRSLKGSMLRQEVYGLDGSAKAQYPYLVTEQNFDVWLLQARGGNRHSVFLAHPRESLSYHYERDPSDPRIAHTLTLEVDEFGNVLRSAAVGYGRRHPDPNLSADEQAKQREIFITATENRVTNAVDAAGDYRTPVAAESRRYHLTGPSLPVGSSRFSFHDVLRAATTATELSYEQAPTAGLQKRVIDHVRTYYRQNDLAGPASLGTLESLALPFERYALALTPGLVTELYGTKVTASMLEDEGGYAHTEGDANWWIPSGRIFYSPGTGDTAPQELAYARQHFFLPHRFRDPFYTNAVSTESLVTYDAYDLVAGETRDALDNRVTVVRQDYRVLQPVVVADVNHNHSEVTFDAMGMVVGTAIMGKPGPARAEGDSVAGLRSDLTQFEIDQFLADPTGASAAQLLDDATTRLVYDLTAYWRDPAAKQPAVAASLARETHVSDLVPGQASKLQLSFAYSDGFAREVQVKIQAEPGPAPKRGVDGKVIVGADGRLQLTAIAVSPRWVGSGWTVFNNKGLPVRQYEPFFSDSHWYEFDVRIGVSPVLLYDPLNRVVATLHPNHSWEKVVFSPWRQKTWDVNDTVLVADPGADSDVADFLSRLPNAEYLPTWYSLRTDPAHLPEASLQWPDPRTRDAERIAAEQTSIHAGTPTVAHADSLGRTVLTVSQNRFQHSGSPLPPPIVESYSSRVVFDIEGNERELIDPEGRVAIRYAYDVLGNRTHQAGMDAGERWTLNDVRGKPIYTWDDRGFRFRTEYDRLRRPKTSLVREGIAAEIVTGRTEYGEGTANPEALNLRWKVIEVRDQAGILNSDEYDFKGNLVRSRRQISQTYDRTLDWSAPVPLEGRVYSSLTRYDALNRPIQVVAPHSDEVGTKVNVVQTAFNEANRVEHVHAWLNRNAEPGGLLDPATATLHAVTGIGYDAKGQRMSITYGNGIVTTYDYDTLTFRLVRLLTQRNADAFPDDCPQPPRPAWPGCQLQNLAYTYDPAGNTVNVRDDSQQTIFFRNNRVAPESTFIYDAVYRLIEATGREHLGQIGGSPIPHTYDDSFRVGLLHPGDGNAIGRYLERYDYDAVGNLLSMQHCGTDPATPGWTRAYTYNETSLLEQARTSNRLTSTSVAAMNEVYSVAGNGYDLNGNMLGLPQFQAVQWDPWNRLRMTRRQAVNGSDSDGIAHDGERTWYVYDSSGQRVRKVTESAPGRVRRERVYLGIFELYRKNAPNPLVRETLHVMDDTQLVALVETRTQGQEPGLPMQLVRYQLRIHLGSINLELDSASRIISYEEYTPFGSTAYQAVRNQTEAPKRYRYTGKERDEESGLYYHGLRYYAPWLARWVSCDPRAPVDGPNPYQYVLGNPIRYSDPSGSQHLEQGTTDDPVVMGCVGGECYMNIRQSRFRELQQQAGVQQQLNTGAAIANNPFSALFWGISRLFTDDPNKQAAAAQLGVATFGVAASVAGVAAGRQQMREVGSVEPLRPVAAEVRSATSGRTASAGVPPSSGVAPPPRSPTTPSTPAQAAEAQAATSVRVASGGVPPPSGGAPPSGTPPAEVGPPGPPPRPQVDVLVVGAESASEFAYARRVAQQGGNVTVVNPVVTAEARAYQQSGGNFVQGRVQELPASARFNLIQEDYPFPLGRAFTPSFQFIEARLGRLKAGGIWVVITESSEFVQALQAAGTFAGARVSVNQIPPAHEATPQSTYPREQNRYAVTFSR